MNQDLMHVLVESSLDDLIWIIIVIVCTLIGAALGALTLYFLAKVF